MPNRLYFHKLRLLSPARNYDVQFHDGANVIAGPILTGKSSVLEILNYACGKRTPLKYPEIKKCSEVLVEISVNGSLFTIQRSLKNSSASATMHFGTIDALTSDEKLESMELLAAPNPRSNLPSISSELLNRLGIGAVKIKNAPKQEASDTDAFSIRDLFSLLFVDQNRMGISPSFFEDKPNKAIKWHAAFQIVHGLYDEQSALLAKALADSLKEQERLKSSLEAAQKFLTDMDVPDIETAELQIREIQKYADRLKQQIQEHKTAEIERLGEHYELITKRDSVYLEYRKNQAGEEELTRTLSQLGRLQVQYEREQRQLKFLIESNKLISKIPITKCPSCFQKLSHEGSDGNHCHLCHQDLQEREDVKGAERQLKALVRRINDLDSYVSELDKEKKAHEKRNTSLLKAIKDTDSSIAAIKASTVFPKDEALLQMSHQMYEAEHRMSRLREHIAYRKKAQGEGSNLLSIEARINDLRNRQEARKAKRPKNDDVIAKLSNHFAEILNQFHFPYPADDARLDPQTYLPLVRGASYFDIRSNGALALIQCAWHFALLEFALDNDFSLFPRCLLLDSPLNHVGKNSTDPMFRDQRIVDGFLNYIKTLHDMHSDEFQLFVCFNESGTTFGDLIAESFTGISGTGRFGLIDDEYTEVDRSGMGSSKSEEAI